MTPEEYQKYLQTAHWQNIRKRLGHSRCHCCSGNNRVQIHHVNYERLYAERDEDLRVLCKFCHAWVHDCIDYCFAPLDRTDWFIKLWRSGVRAYVDVRRQYEAEFGKTPETLMVGWRQQKYLAVCRKIARCHLTKEKPTPNNRNKRSVNHKQRLEQTLLYFWRCKRAELTGQPIETITGDMARSFRKNKFSRHERRRMELEYLESIAELGKTEEKMVSVVDQIHAFQPPKRSDQEIEAIRKAWNFNK